MDHTEALPDDALAHILGRLSARDVAISRCVRKAWLAVVDARRLLLLNLEDLLHSVCGLYIAYVDYYETPRLFARPSAQPTMSLSFLPSYRDYTCVDHCNGLLLCRYWPRLCVVNPATTRWEYIDYYWRYSDANPYLVFDHAASPHYEVISIPRVPKKAEQDDPQDLTEWPPSSWTLDVFSSSMRQWEERSFIREGDVVGTTNNVRVDPLEHTSMCWRQWGGPRWGYSAYWQGSLYVHCGDAFVVRYTRTPLLSHFF
jgi:hypothetical protein